MNKLVLVLVLVFGTLFYISPVQATDSDGKCYTTVIDQESWTEVLEEAHWQRYSWTGGPHSEDSPPAFPSDDWQANVKGDPHNVGVVGAYFRSHGNAGNGDWFYLDFIPENTVYHEATYMTIEVPCDNPTDPEITPPDPLIETEETVTYNCGDDFQTVHVVRTTTTYDPESGPIAWDILDVVVDEFDVIEPHEVEVCSSSDEPVTDKPKSKVPTVAPDAGLPNTGA